MNERQQLEQAILAQESLRGTVDDAIVDASIAALRKQLAELEGPALDERRKLVTVLFADLAGFTAMSEEMAVYHLERMVSSAQNLDISNVFVN